MRVFVNCSPARVAPWLLAIAIAIAADPVDAASGDYPADPSGDVEWPWSDWAPAKIETIMEKFNAARAQDPTISVDLVIEYTQDEWDALSDNQKGLYLSNKERVDRGIAPYAAVAKQVSDVAQDYATYLYEVEQTLTHRPSEATWTGSGRDASSCCSPSNRLAAALGNEKEFFRFSENLAWTSAGDPSRFPEPVAYSVYAWIYDDAGSGWGHRHFSLAELNDNAGEANVEGLLGFGVARGAAGTYTVMNVADEAAGWDHTSDSNLILWSSMVGGNSGANGDAPASDPSPSTNEKIEEAFEDTGEAIEDSANVVKETGDGGLLAAVVIVFATLLIGFAMWQHALLDPEGCSARVLKAAVGAERFRAAHEAPRSWRRCSCLIPPAPAEEEEQAQKRRGFFGLFRGGKDAREEDKRKEEEAKEASGGGLFGLFRGGKDAREEDKRKEEEAKEASGGGLFGLFRGGKDAREEDKRKEEEAKEARGGGLFGRSRV